MLFSLNFSQNFIDSFGLICLILHISLQYSSWMPSQIFDSGYFLAILNMHVSFCILPGPLIESHDLIAWADPGGRNVALCLLPLPRTVSLPVSVSMSPKFKATSSARRRPVPKSRAITAEFLDPSHLSRCASSMHAENSSRISPGETWRPFGSLLPLTGAMSRARW